MPHTRGIIKMISSLFQCTRDMSLSKTIFTVMLVFTLSMIHLWPSAVAQTSKRYWRDTLCQNHLRLNYTPVPFTASVQTPPVYDFIRSTLVQVYSGIAAAQNDTVLSFTTLIYGFGNLSVHTATPLFIRRSKDRKSVFYQDMFSVCTATVPNQSGTLTHVFGSAGLGLHSNILLSGELNKLHFILRHKLGASMGKYPGFRMQQHRLIFYQSVQLRVRSVNGSLVLDFPLKITNLPVQPLLSVSYFQKI